jgi:hypothetical protein
MPRAINQPSKKKGIAMNSKLEIKRELSAIEYDSVSGGGSSPTLVPPPGGGTSSSITSAPPPPEPQLPPSGGFPPN